VQTGSESRSFGSLLRQARTAAALSQEELAERAGVSARGVSDLERGLRRAPRLETVRLLADALGLDAVGRAALIAAARAPLDDAESPVAPSPGLPEPPTRLVGREREMAELARLLGGHGVRLLTLTGPGGSGKTRLAIAAATEAGDYFPDGVVFVDLAPLTHASLVLPSIAQGVGLRNAGAELVEAMRAFLAGKRMLLVLDNFEHVLEAARVLADLLRALPGLTVLTTSREPLRLRGEREFAVQPLNLPGVGNDMEPARLLESGAVALFVERVRDVRANFALTPENAVVVADICRRLDGLPLALELAAARARGLPLSLLRERLEAALPLLTGGARDAPARQRSLRETIAWSFDLLSAEEQALFRRLGVFAGGWTLDAAEAVARGEGFDVLSGIGSLVEKNLIRLDESGSAPRYRMLETIREFALDRLDQHDETAEVRRAHAAFFAELVIAAESGLSSGRLADVARVGADLDNLRTALGWLLDAGDGETALRVATSLSEYWTFAGGQFGEGYAWLERALALGDDASPSARAGGYYGIAMLALHQADLVRGRAAATTGLALARSAGDSVRIAGNAFMLSSVEGSEDHRDEALTLAREAKEAALAAGDANWTGWSLLLLGAEHHAAGDLQQAVADLEEAIRVFRMAGGRWGEADAVERLAATVRDVGDLPRTAALHAQSLVLRRDVGASTGIQNQLIGLAHVASESGDLFDAAILLGAASAHLDRYGYASFRDTPAIRDRVELQVRRELGEAPFERARDRGRALSTGDAIAEALAIADGLSGTRPDDDWASRAGLNW
jgi:predicted ATPase/DNA-binding XRE family transcriptional regulator